MSAPVPFTKMSGAGNDFIVLDGTAWSDLAGDRTAWVRAVCRRGLSVGADGVLVVSPEAPGRVRVEFFNPDGGMAFCGNGSRCAARFAVLRGLALGPTLTLKTAVGDVPAELDGSAVRLTLPPPEDRGEVVLEVDGTTYRGRLVSAGVPHLVLPVTRLASFPLAEVGPALRKHPALGPSGANVNVVEGGDDGRVHVRTFERGVENETLSCGTGAVAVALAARLAGAPETVVVVPRSRSMLTVTLRGDPRGAPLATLSGDARMVFEGRLDAEATTSTP